MSESPSGTASSVRHLRRTTAWLEQGGVLPKAAADAMQRLATAAEADATAQVEGGARTSSAMAEHLAGESKRALEAARAAGILSEDAVSIVTDAHAKLEGAVGDLKGRLGIGDGDGDGAAADTEAAAAAADIGLGSRALVCHGKREDVVVRWGVCGADSDDAGARGAEAEAVAEAEAARAA